jgi:hypothetical protein
VRPKEVGVFIGDKTRYARDGLYNQRRTEVYRYGEVSSVEAGLVELKKRRSSGVKIIRGNNVDMQRVGKRVELSKAGVRSVEGRATDRREERRYHVAERGRTGKTVSDVLSRADSCLRRGRDLKNERPMRQTWRRSRRVMGGSTEAGSAYVQRGPGGYGRAAKAMDLGRTVGHLNERREGRHRRSQARTETGIIRRNETRASRSHPRVVEKIKQRDEVAGKSRVNVVSPKGNGRGRRALGVDREGPTRPARVVIGVDDGERVENGRASLNDLAEKKNGKVVCVMNSHAPTRSGSQVEGVERRIPRKTAVEADQRMVNREGKARWTTGVGTMPKKQGEVGGGVAESQPSRVDTSRWAMEERSDPYGEEDRTRQRRRATRGVATLDGAWNDRRRADRYDYYREGHAINRVSKVMAKCSIDQVTARGKRKSTTLE